MSERFKALDIWLPAYLRQSSFQAVEGQEYHVLVAICDHFEPLHHADEEQALQRVSDWEKHWPTLTSRFSDGDGVRPRYSFFYPIEQYRAALMEALAGICRSSGAEVEIHLHHGGETGQQLEEILQQGVFDLARHGFLSRGSSKDQKPGYAFIHGNWALNHSHPQGLHCGVPEELRILQETGCFVDMTYPAAPNRCQPSRINSICRLEGQGREALNRAKPMVAQSKSSGLLMVQGPLGLNWKRRKLGFLPRIENGDLTGANPPNLERFDLWVKQGIRVQGGPPWIFVKLHTHGGIPRNYNMLLGDPMARFLEDLQARQTKRDGFHLHYVTAREMANIALAAEAGETGNPHDFRNFQHAPPPVVAS